jgi:regulator of cell morphogenesis and NO signaling
MTTHLAARSVSELVASQPNAVQALQRHGIDTCCGGGLTLEEACRQSGITLEELLEEVHNDESLSAHGSGPWESQPIGKLIDHILESYHRPLYAELPRLEALARRLLETDAKTPERFSVLLRLLHTFLTLREQLEEHMRKEETALFPWMRRGASAADAEMVQLLTAEHQTEGLLLRKLRHATDDYTPPEDASPTWHALVQGLEILETGLKEHIHLESKILFPRVASALRAKG